MASPPSHGEYDYTEGASPYEITRALSEPEFETRPRRDSQVGSVYDEAEGKPSPAIYDGYVAGTIPSSVTSYASRSSSSKHRRPSISRAEYSGISSSRRRSTEDSDVALADDDEEESQYNEDVPMIPRTRLRRKTSERPPSRNTVLDSIAGIFSRPSHTPESLMGRSESMSRRSSVSHGSTRLSKMRRSMSSSSAGAIEHSLRDDNDDEERWGYSSGEEGQLSPTELSNLSSHDGDILSSPTTSLPVLPRGNDSFFGDTRIDMSVELGFQELPKPPPGPPSRQSVYIVDEDMTVLFVGYEVLSWRRWAWLAGCIVSFGALGLAGLWNPRLWLRWVAREVPFESLGELGSGEGIIMAETPYRDISLPRIATPNYPYSLSSIFPPASPSDPASGSRPVSAVNVAPSSSHRLNTVDRSMGFLGAMPPDQVNGLKILDYRYVRFVLDHNTGLFEVLRDWRDPGAISVSTVCHGIDSETRKQRAILFGENIIDMPGKPVFTLLIEEALHPFYVFQIASIILWSLDDYYYYAFCIALMSTFSVVTTLVETKKTVERMREMSKFSCPVQILSEGNWKTVSSVDLIPGDVVNIMAENISLFPADMLLLSGDAIVNESMLTGESVPIGKTPIKDQDLVRWKDGIEIGPETAKGFLYAGTKVVRIRGGVNGPEGEQALALVVHTGFNTTKGSLIRSMLFPKPIGFKFYRDSMRFIAFLACVAGVGFLASVVQFVKLGIKFHTILVRALDLVTIVVPPALPATLSIGTTFAINRLRKLGIFCISPNRINIAGRINVIYGLDILGVRCLDRSGDLFGELITDVHDLPTVGGTPGKASFLHALATCHSLKVLDGNILGDPLDARMFEFTHWTIEEGRTGPPGQNSMANTRQSAASRPTALVQTVVRPPGSAGFRVEDALKAGTKHAHFLELGVIRIFEFLSTLRRMSVVVKRLKSSSMEIYVKGAPEVMSEICDPSTFPKDYDDLLSYYTRHGYRVIAIAGKSIEGLSWLKAQRMKRDQAESGLRFLGLIIFENKLKPGTAPAIQTLRSAHLAIRMVTGDNHRTAISVARECGLITQSMHVFFPVFVVGNPESPASKLEWTSVDDEMLKLDAYSLKPLPPRGHHIIESGDIAYHDYTLALTGDVFRWMINNAPLETLQRMFVKAQIFARMSPDEKHELVSRLQSLGYTVAFCGDGANDCGALKAADVGLSLSEAEASVAAPFTSRTPDISCVIEVIKQGRAALVTSFSCFKYMHVISPALYSIIQFTTITLLYSFASSLGDLQFLYIDLFIIIPVAVTMGRTLPYNRIHPQPPTASLVSPQVLSSIIGQIILTSAFQFWAFFWARSQPWYLPPHPASGSDGLDAMNYENTVLFLISSFQYIFVAAVFSIGPPYRLPLWTNVLLMLCIVVLTAFSALVLLAPPTIASSVLGILAIPLSARLTLLGGVVTNALLCGAMERWEPLAKVVVWVGASVNGRPRRAFRDGRLYKAVESGM
ncbi:hypothetical protein BS47DRAFT_1375107 [Hydnum rufescens UP504]|uniref:Cation-transporting ATPase n=1 Tax=Hydnum rufescens UP504 TaxID=1448309 RepID=A0A9P6B7E0_9AGAM|nr:hypothetical protein BS47DRAFT_1375107 [Hydnum rufescens UP504]